MLKLPTLKHRKPIVYISLGIYLLLIIFIIVEAFLSSDISGQQSQTVAKISADVINNVPGSNGGSSINQNNYSEFHSFMRKFTGHFFLFLVTGVFGFIFFYTYFEENRKIWILLLITLILGGLIAGLSELIQLWIPSRAGMMEDVGIDSLGYLIGTLLTLGIIYLVIFIKNKNQNKKEIPH